MRGVGFDADAGLLLSGRCRHDGDLDGALRLPSDRVMLVSNGLPTPCILRAARDMGARIVTYDPFRDWAGDVPEITRQGHLIKGGVRQGRVRREAGAGAARG